MNPSASGGQAEATAAQEKTKNASAIFPTLVHVQPADNDDNHMDFFAIQKNKSLMWKKIYICIAFFVT